MDGWSNEMDRWTDRGLPSYLTDFDPDEEAVEFEDLPDDYEPPDYDDCEEYEDDD